jgi:hypothetical protein
MQGVLLTPVSDNVLGGALGTDVLNIGGAAALTAGVAFQLYTASVNYARNAPEGYNAVKDVRVSGGWIQFLWCFYPVARSKTVLTRTYRAWVIEHHHPLLARTPWGGGSCSQLLVWHSSCTLRV